MKPITVKELKEKLNECPDDAIVVLPSRVKEDKFSPFEDFETGEYEPETAWLGEFYPLDENGNPCKKEAVAFFPIH